MPACPYGCGVNHRSAPTASNCSKYPSSASDSRSSWNPPPERAHVVRERSAAKNREAKQKKSILKNRLNESVGAEKARKAALMGESAHLSDEDFYSDDHVFAYAERMGWQADYSAADDGTVTLYASDYSDGEDDDLIDEEVAAKYSAMYDTDFGQDGIHIESIPRDSDEFDPNNEDTKLNGAGQRKIVGSKYAVMNFMSGAEHFEGEEGAVVPDHYGRQEPNLEPSPRTARSRTISARNAGDDGPGDYLEERRLRSRYGDDY